MASIQRAKNGVWRVQVSALGKRTSATFRTKREACAWGAQTEMSLKDSVMHRRVLQKKIGAGDCKLSHDEILKGRVRVASHPGIYILFSGEMVTYVGQSRNVIKRITSHAEKGRAFDSYYVIPCLPDDLDAMERRYIEMLDPPENKTSIMPRSLTAVGRRSAKRESTPLHSGEAAHI